MACTLPQRAHKKPGFADTFDQIS